MTTTETKHPYRVRMETWDIKQHKDCSNFQRVKEWSIANGYVLDSDVSYNGFLEIRKTICEGHKSDGHRLELQIFCNESVSDKDKYHSLNQYDMEIDFENDSILKPTKYRYKMQHGIDKSMGTRDLEALLAFTLEREAVLKAEYEQYLKENPTTEWKMTDPDNFQYGRMVRGVYEFKEFDRASLPKVFEMMKKATQKKLDAYIAGCFDDEFVWITKKVFISKYTDADIEDVISSYYKSLPELKEIHGTDWEFIVAECIFEQESLLY